MLLLDKTIEELLDLEEELIEAKENEKDNSLVELIRLYEELFRKISADRKSEYTSSLDQIKKTLVAYLVRYGSYLKTQYQKDDHSAASTLKKAIMYQKELPLAYYRHGFLSYKQRDYLKAITHFQLAIDYQEKCSQTVYLLNQQQLYNAQLYKSNSALYIADTANAYLKEIESEELSAKAPSYEQSPLFQLISQNEAFLHAHAFTVVSAGESRLCSKEECENIIVENLLPDTFILYFSDGEHSLYFNRKNVRLSINHAEILRFFFLHTTEQSPATKYHFERIFSENQRGKGEIPTNTYIQNVRRIQKKIESLSGTHPVITNKRYQGQTGYYYNQTIPYTIIHRSDHSFTL
ncbi:hypothetical protein R4Z09_19615 [Niallia oryzisoli]|uniref:Uncharacterized protein n=1 Tax=Niallia oryzisoli TaxID=1737571 RepID=A0ABZ2CC28_9BACI